VPLASQGFGEQSAEASAGTGNENDLLGTHVDCLLVALP
jgi:hypothetical protein